MLVGGLLLAGAGCKPSAGPSGQQPSPSPYQPTASPLSQDQRRQQLLEFWDHQYDGNVEANSFQDLPWEVPKPSKQVEAPCIFMTGDQSSISLQLPEALFQAGYLKAIKEGKVLGYRQEGQSVVFEIGSNTIYPLRARPPAFRSTAVVRCQVKATQGDVLVCVAHQRIGKQYGFVSPLSVSSQSQTQSPPPRQEVHVSKGLGFRGKDVAFLDAEMKRKYGINDNRGIFVESVLPDTPASRGGLQPHDVIHKLGERPIHTSGDLLDALDKTAAGTKVTLQVYRPDVSAGADIPVDVVVGEFRADVRYTPSAKQ